MFRQHSFKGHTDMNTIGSMIFAATIAFAAVAAAISPVGATAVHAQTAIASVAAR